MACGGAGGDLAPPAISEEQVVEPLDSKLLGYPQQNFLPLSVLPSSRPTAAER
jgi:hypothetical protein